MEIAGKKFLVVGGSGVLGQQLVSQLHSAGAEVLATASSNESAGRIPAVAKVRLLLDLTKPESITTLTSYLAATELSLDGVILASGVVGFGPAEGVEPTLLERLNRVNYLGQVQLVGELLPMLRAASEAAGESVVASLTGVVASMPMAGLSHYSASKTAMAGYLAALAKEVGKHNIKVVDARPGHTETGLATRPLFGSTPNFGVGLAPGQVASKLLAGLGGNESILEANYFKG